MMTHRAPVKKALCVGCNYPSKAMGLMGSVNDAFLLADMLKDHYGFEPDNVKVLHDMYIWSKKSDRVAEEDNSTRYNIQKWMEWLIDDVHPGDVLFFSFSGYGIQVDEHPHGFADEGLEECLMPTDFMDERDRWCVLPLSVIHDTLLSVPVGVSVNVLFDCDNANTFLDMTGTMTGDWTRGLKFNGYFGIEPFARRMEHSEKDPRVWQDENARDVKGRARWQGASEILNIRRGRAPQKVRMPKMDPVAFAFAASRHDQTCMECQIDKVWFEGRQKTISHGCMTYAFVKAMEKTGYDCTVFDVVDLVNIELAAIRESHLPNLDQEVQLTYAQPNSWPTRTKFLQPVDMSRIPEAIEPTAPWECIMKTFERFTGLTGIAKSINGVVHNWLGNKNSHHEELIRAAKPSRHPPKVPPPPKEEPKDDGKIQPQWWEEMMDQKDKAPSKYDKIRAEKAAAKEQSQRRTSAQIQNFLEMAQAHQAMQAAEAQRPGAQNSQNSSQSQNPELQRATSAQSRSAEPPQQWSMGSMGNMGGLGSLGSTGNMGNVNQPPPNEARVGSPTMLQFRMPNSGEWGTPPPNKAPSGEGHWGLPQSSESQQRGAASGHQQQQQQQQQQQHFRQPSPMQQPPQMQQMQQMQQSQHQQQQQPLLQKTPDKRQRSYEPPSLANSQDWPCPPAPPPAPQRIVPPRMERTLDRKVQPQRHSFVPPMTQSSPHYSSSAPPASSSSYPQPRYSNHLR